MGNNRTETELVAARVPAGAYCNPEGGDECRFLDCEGFACCTLFRSAETLDGGTCGEGGAGPRYRRLEICMEGGECDG
jgi:hypothetical protein